MIVSLERYGTALGSESVNSYTRAESFNMSLVKELNGHFSISVLIVALGLCMTVDFLLYSFYLPLIRCMLIHSKKKNASNYMTSWSLEHLEVTPSIIFFPFSEGHGKNIVNCTVIALKIQII